MGSVTQPLPNKHTINTCTQTNTFFNPRKFQIFIRYLVSVLKQYKHPPRAPAWSVLCSPALVSFPYSAR